MFDHITPALSFIKCWFLSLFMFYVLLQSLHIFSFKKSKMFIFSTSHFFIANSSLYRSKETQEIALCSKCLIFHNLLHIVQVIKLFVDSNIVAQNNRNPCIKMEELYGIMINEIKDM